MTKKSGFAAQTRYYPYIPKEMEYCLRREAAKRINSGSRCLDLLAGRFTYIPDYVKPSEVIGIGLNKEEMAENKQLTGCFVQDLNKINNLPFEKSSFDAVVMTSGMAYLANPDALVNLASDLLKPGGVLFIAFTDKHYEPEATDKWKEMAPEQRTLFAQKIVRLCSKFRDIRHEIFNYDTTNRSCEECGRLDILSARHGIGKNHELFADSPLTIMSFNALSAARCLAPLIERKIFGDGRYTIKYNKLEFQASDMALPFLKERLIDNKEDNCVNVKLLPSSEKLEDQEMMFSVDFHLPAG